MLFTYMYCLFSKLIFTLMSITPLASLDLSSLITGADDNITDDFETSTIMRTVGSVVCRFYDENKFDCH